MFNAGSTLIPLFCRQYQGGNKLSTGKSHRMDVHAIVLYPEEGKESYVKQYQQYCSWMTKSSWDGSNWKKSQENILTHEDECENFVLWSWERKHEKKLLRKLLHCKRLYFLLGCGVAVFCLLSKCLQIIASRSRRAVARLWELTLASTSCTNTMLKYQEPSLLPPGNCKAGSIAESICWFYFPVWLSATIGSKQQDLDSSPSRVSSCLPV